MESKAELQERLKVIETLITEYKTRLLTLQEQRLGITAEIKAFVVADEIAAEKEAAENETLIEKEKLL